MAIGDRIGSARTCGYMRRINALENYGTYSTAGSLIRTIPQFTEVSNNNQGDYIYSNFDGILYYGVANHPSGAIFKIETPIVQDTGTVLISSSTTPSSTLIHGMKDFFVYNDKITVLMRHESGVTASGFTEYIIRQYNIDGSSPINVTTETSDTNYPNYKLDSVGIAGNGDFICKSVERTGSGDSLDGRFNVTGNLFELGGIFKAMPTKGGSGFTAVNTSGLSSYDSDLSIIATETTPISEPIVLTLNGDHVIKDQPNSTGLMYRDLGFIMSISGFFGTSTEYIVIDDSSFIYEHRVTYPVGGTLSKISGRTPTSTQTTFYQYPTLAVDTGKITLGTPDYGATVPVDTALQGLRPHYFELRDMRDAIESVATDYENPATNAAYTLTAGTNNIFRVAIDSGQDDWTTTAVTHTSRIREDYYSDINDVLTQLELSALV